MIEVKVPHVGVNDEFVTLVEVQFEDFTEIKEGDIICTIETSKAIHDVESPVNGFLKMVAGIGDTIKVGENLFYVLSDPDEKILLKNEESSKLVKFNATKKAVLLAEKHNVDLSKIKTSTIIKEKDVLEFIETSKNMVGEKGDETGKKLSDALGAEIGKTVELNKTQQLIASNLSSVHHQAVTSYFTISLPGAELNNLLAELKESQKKIVTFTELLIFVMKNLLKEYELMNAFYADKKINYYSDINIGFTVDLNDKLIVPVIKNVPEKKFTEIVKEANVLRMNAMMNKLNTSNIIGGTFTITNLMDNNILFFMPILNLYQSAILAVSGNIENDNSSGNIYLTLGIDHRIINGKYASSFLASLKDKLKNLTIEDFGN